jgi:hypothetical protein
LILKLTHSDAGNVSYERRLLTFEGYTQSFDEMPDLLDKQAIVTFRFKSKMVIQGFYAKKAETFHCFGLFIKSK